MNLPLKPGRTTTEFWAIILTGLSLTGLASFALLDAEWVAGAMTLLTIIYNASRGQLKKQQAEAELEALRYELRVSEEEARHDRLTGGPILPTTTPPAP